jgi:hypothetical protein
MQKKRHSPEVCIWGRQDRWTICVQTNTVRLGELFDRWSCATEIDEDNIYTIPSDLPAAR